MEIRPWHFKSRDRLFLLWLDYHEFKVGDYWNYDDFKKFKHEQWVKFCEARRLHPERVKRTTKLRDDFYEFTKNALYEQIKLL